MKRQEIAPGVFLTQVPGEKFKRCKISLNLIVPGRRENATALALLPHVLDRRCAAVPNATELARLLFSLYGAELTSESYTAGVGRLVTLGISGLKSAYALNGEDLAARYLELLLNLLFDPVTENGAFAAEDVAIEVEKQTEFLKSEFNDKRSYCLRQARRKLYRGSPLGIESPGYLEDLPKLSPQSLYAEYKKLLATAQMEVLVCGVDAAMVAEKLTARLNTVPRSPAPMGRVEPLPTPAALDHYSEPMETVQGKLCIICTSGVEANAKTDAVMRLASALYGGLPTSRLFVNVREKQSLCYYCSSSFGYFGGTLTIDSGVDHQKAKRASTAILHELEGLQKAPVTDEELRAAKLYLASALATAKDSPDALMNWSFNEWLKGTNRSLDEMINQAEAVTAEEIQAALAAFHPAVEYVITGKEAQA